MSVTDDLLAEIRDSIREQTRSVMELTEAVQELTSGIGRLDLTVADLAGYDDGDEDDD